jgi:hypothetical protein
LSGNVCALPSNDDANLIRKRDQLIYGQYHWGKAAVMRLTASSINSLSSLGKGTVREISMTRKELAEILSHSAKGEEICVPYDVFQAWGPLAKSARLFLFASGHGCSVRNDQEAQQICFRKHWRRPAMTFPWKKWRLKSRRRS